MAGALVTGSLEEVTSPRRPPSPQEDVPEGAVWVDDGSAITLKVFGKDEGPVIVQAISATHFDCSAPSGTWTWLMTGGGGAYINHPLLIKLPPGGGGHTASGLEQPYNGEKWHFPRQVSQAEAEGYEIEVSAPVGKICEFDLQVGYETAAGERRQAKVTSSEGKPFRVADPAVASATIDYGS